MKKIKMEEFGYQFHYSDYIIFVVTILVSLGIGIYYALSGGRQRTTSEFLVADRKMPVLPVAMSMMVSFESAVMILGVPAEIYVYGFQWIIGNLGFFVANMIAVKIAVPLIHPLNITSTYEYLELRFKSRAVRILGTTLGILFDLCYMGVVLFGPAVALEAVTGFPQWASILAVAVAATIYTAIGGIKAVIWTDVFQCLLMFAGFFAVLIKGTLYAGGVRNTWKIAEENGRLNVFNFDPDPTVRHTFWCLFFGNLMRGFGQAFRQTSVQRICSTPTQSSARKVLLFFAPGFFLSMSLAGVVGIIAFAYYYTQRCDPMASGQISNPNQIIPFMITDIFRNLHGMPGLFMASLFSATLSTLSSGFSSMSALFWEDLVKPHIKPVSETKATMIAKGAVLLFGALTVLLAYLCSLIGGTLIQIGGSIIAAFAGPLTGLFMLGALCPWATSKGALSGGVISAIFVFVISLGQMTTPGSVKNAKLLPAPTDMCPVANATIDVVTNVTSLLMYNVTDHVTTPGTIVRSVIQEPTGFKRLFMLSYQWFNTTGILATVAIGTIVSLATGGNKPGDVDPRYMIPLFDTLCCCLPENLRKILRCGMVFKTDREDSEDGAEYEMVGTNNCMTDEKGDVKPKPNTRLLENPHQEQNELLQC